MKKIRLWKYAGWLLTSMILVALNGCATTPVEPVSQPVVAPEPQMVVEEAEVPVVMEQVYVPEPEPEPAPMQTMHYTVNQGDHLWAIAGLRSVYGDSFQWPLIYKDNQGQIIDADLIFPGQVLTISVNPDSAEVAAAIEHARTRGPWSLGVVEASDRLYLSR